MLSFLLVQETIAARVNGDSYFAAVVGGSPKAKVKCIVDDGTKGPEIESELNGAGMVLIAEPVLRGVKTSQGRQLVGATVEAVVRVACNPEANGSAQGSKRDIREVVQNLIRAVLGWSPGSPGDRSFEMSEEFLQLVTNDPGLVEYEVFFLKQVTF